MNFLYCLDNNFNLQALNSINSIIRNSEDEDLKFYIIHETPEKFKIIIDKYADINEALDKLIKKQ